MQKLAWCSALVSSAQAKIIAATANNAGILFYNLNDSSYPNAKDEDGNALGNHLKWEIHNQSFIDEDTGYQYIEFTNTLRMPVLASDEITFHVEFTSADKPAGSTSFYRDGMECKVTK